MPPKIKHTWFDFSDSLAFLKRERHNQLRYESYSEVVGRPVTNQLKATYEELYHKFSNSNAALFASLGMPANYWSKRINSVSPSELYEIADPAIPGLLQQLKIKLPISVFSNIQLGNVLPALGIDPAELSNLPAENILYIGDHVAKDVLPAKQVGIQSGLLWKSSPEADYSEADYSFERFEDILRLL